MNERTRERLDAFDGDQDTYPLMCECATTECADMIDVPRPEYHRVRACSTWFMVLPDHVSPGADEVIERGDGFWVVRKVDEVGRVASDNYNAPDGGD